MLRFTPPALDYYAWLGKRQLPDVEELTDWAVRHGWIQQAVDVVVRDPEEDVIRVPEESREWRRWVEDPSSVKRVTGWRMTPKLRKRITKHYPRIVDHRCWMHEVLNLWLADEHPEIGMVWYTHPRYPEYGSFPQGAILPGHFDAIEPVAITTLRGWPAAKRRASKSP